MWPSSVGIVKMSYLQVCAASQKKSLAGLDNIAAEGSFAFDSLINVVDMLGECGRYR